MGSCSEAGSHERSLQVAPCMGGAGRLCTRVCPPPSGSVLLLWCILPLGQESHRCSISPIHLVLQLLILTKIPQQGLRFSSYGQFLVLAWQEWLGMPLVLYLHAPLKLSRSLPFAP